MIRCKTCSRTFTGPDAVFNGIDHDCGLLLALPRPTLAERLHRLDVPGITAAQRAAVRAAARTPRPSETR